MQELLQHSLNPWILFFAIIAFAWLWEDGALISGALLAVEGKLSVPVAVVAIFLGICSGDMALYMLGRLAHRWRRVRAWIFLNPGNRQLGRQFRTSTMMNIMIIRFIPGLRTIGFTLCGVWRINTLKFFTAMSVAGIVWIAAIFSVIYCLGSSAWLEDSAWKWSLIGVAIMMLFLNNYLARRRLLLKHNQSHKSHAHH